MPLPLASRRTLSEAPLAVPAVLLAGDYPDPNLFVGAPHRSQPIEATNPAVAASAPHGAESRPAPALDSGVASAPTDIPAPSGGLQEPLAPAAHSSIPTDVLVWLDPRDPFSLLAHWDAEEASIQRFCAAFPGDALRLRVYARQVGGVLMSDQIVIPTARHRLVPVLYANTPYVAELGFVDSAGLWRSLATSAKVQTPPDHHVSEWTERRGRFQARPSPPPPSDPASHTEPQTISSVVTPAPAAIFTPVPGPAETPASPLPPLLDEPAAQYLTTLVWEPAPVIISPGSSVEMAQWVAKVVTTRWEGPTTPPLSPSSAEQTRPAPELAELPGVPGSVPAPAPAPSSFWFKVNAELIIYGSTEPDAQVTLGGRPIRLRDDGSFSFRFSLPDGDFELPALAVKADGSDQRAARLQFQRTTTRQGDVGTHPTDPHWKPPVPESLP